MTHGLIGMADHERLGFASDDPATIRIVNPVAHDHVQLRRSLLPGLLTVLATNERQRRADVAIFEVGSVHHLADGVPIETVMLGILLAGDWVPRAWDRPGRTAEMADVIGLVEWLVARLGAGRLERVASAPWDQVEHPGRVAALRAVDSDLVIGRAGELDPRYVEATDVRAERVAFALLELDALADATPTAQRLVPIPRVAAVERDVAVIVDDETFAAVVESVIRDAAGPMLADVTLFDRYHGAPLVAGEVSLAYRLRLQAEQTLTDAAIESLVEGVVAALVDRCGARLRV